MFGNACGVAVGERVGTVPVTLDQDVLAGQTSISGTGLSVQIGTFVTVGGNFGFEKVGNSIRVAAP